MTVIGIDDTDSRERGMCTTYVAARLAARLREAGASVERPLLVRLNPAIEHKTRGNAALALATDAAPERALALAGEAVERWAETADPKTNPGVVVAPGTPREVPDAVPDAVADWARRALRSELAPSDARALAADAGYRHREWGTGQGLVGALAAVGADAAFEDWSYECLSYREPDRWGTSREVDVDSLFDAAEAAYPEVWDTVDAARGEPIAVPRTPCPVLHGIRGETPEAVASVARAVESEPVARRLVVRANQGTDAHLREGSLGDLAERRAYRVDGTVATAPETREGGHVFFDLADGDDAVRCAAFEPTKRFRDRVRALRPGDRLTVCGEVTAGTLKLEKFAVRDLDATELVTPDCPDCGRSMESAGRDQGYRCRDCATSAPGKVERAVERDLDRGWYEVPPRARRHVARPLVRGGFDAPTHPER